MGRKYVGQTKDITFSWVTEIDPEFEQWRSLSEEWLITVLRDKSSAIGGVGKFLNDYIHKHNLTKVPSVFLNRSFSAVSFTIHALLEINIDIKQICNV